MYKFVSSFFKIFHYLFWWGGGGVLIRYCLFICFYVFFIYVLSEDKNQHAQIL